MKYLIVASVAMLALSGCNNAASTGADLQENPSEAVSEERLVENAAAGNMAMPDSSSGVTAVDPTAVVGSSSSAPGAATAGRGGAGQTTGGSDGGRTLGDK